MATTRTLSLDDVLNGAAYDDSSGSGNEFIQIPLSELTAKGGLSATEANSDDGRLIAFAVIRTVFQNVATIESAFDVVYNKAKSWTTGKSYTTADYINHNEVIYKASQDHTAGATLDASELSTNWSEQTLQQEPDNFKPKINAATYASGDFGVAEIKQRYQLDVVYEGTTDLKAES